MRVRLGFLLAAVTVLFVGGLTLVRSSSATFRVEKYWPEIEAAAKDQGLPSPLLAGLVYVESRGNPEAVSSSGALGLMQLKLDSAREAARRLGLPPPAREDLFEPRLNLRLGAAYLRWMQERFRGDLDLAVMAYFAGPGAVEAEVEKDGGDSAKTKARLAEQAWSAGEYLLQVKDRRSRFEERRVQ